MNQTQRKFLLDSIESQYKTEKSTLDKQKPSAPSLNNYLIASILDGSFVMKQPEVVRAAIRERVVKLGKNDSLLCNASDTWGHRCRQDEDEDDNTFIKIPASVIFDLPERYAAEKAAYEKDLEEWEARAQALSASFEAMKIKVQLGSDDALSALIDQADKLCSMSLTYASKLFITDRK